jgi:hypothetical protein
MVFPRRSRGGSPPRYPDGDEDDDLDFEPIVLSQPRRRTGLWLALFGLVALGGAAGGGWYFLDDFLGESVDTSVPMIRADIAPIKVRPESPGGMQVPDQDKLVYDRMQGEGEGSQVEQLLPPPEAPLPLPAPPPAKVVAEKPPATETEIAEAAIAEAVPPPPPQPEAPPQPPAPATSEQPASGPISLVPEKQPPPAPKPAEVAEQLLPAPEKPKPVETAAPPPPKLAPPPPKPVAPPPKPVPPPPKPVASPPKPVPPPTKPVETKPAKPLQTPPAKTETAVPSKPKPTPPPKKTVKPTRVHQIQIAAVRSPKGARGEWKRLQRKHRELLGKLKLSIVKADLGPKKGIYYRLRAGPVADERAARSLCAALKKRKVGCMIVRPKG